MKIKPVYLVLDSMTAISNFRHVEGDKIEFQPLNFIHRLSNDDEDSLPIKIKTLKEIIQ